jgi:hypothetical protein
MSGQKTTAAVEAAGHTQESWLYATGWIASGLLTAATIVAVWQFGL